MPTTELFFTRQEGLHTTNTCLLTLTHSETLATNEQILEALIEGVTDYLQQSEQGRKAWNDTCHNFNIGDLDHQNESDVLPYLQPHGISTYSLTFQNAERSIPFDTVLSHL